MPRPPITSRETIGQRAFSDLPPRMAGAGKLPLLGNVRTKQLPEKAMAQNQHKQCIVKLSDIELPERWNRKSAGSLKELAADLKERGQLVPLNVRPGTKEGKYILVDGRRRVMALKDVGVKEAMVTVLDANNDIDAYLDSMRINLHRQGHTPLELAESFEFLQSAGLKNKEIAQRCGISESSVSQYLSVLRMPKPVQKEIDKGEIGLGLVRQLNRLSGDEHQKAFDKFCTRACSGQPANQLIEDIENYLSKAAVKKNTEDGAEKSDKKPRGRPVAVPDYASETVRDAIHPLDAGQLHTELTSWALRLSRTNSEKSRATIKGILTGLEIAAQLRKDEE